MPFDPLNPFLQGYPPVPNPVWQSADLSVSARADSPFLDAELIGKSMSSLGVMPPYPPFAEPAADVGLGLTSLTNPWTSVLKLTELSATDPTWSALDSYLGLTPVTNPGTSSASKLTGLSATDPVSAAIDSRIELTSLTNPWTSAVSKLTALSAADPLSPALDSHNGLTPLTNSIGVGINDPSTSIDLANYLNLNSSAGAGPASIAGIYETAIRQFPRPFDFFNPFLQTTPSQLENGPWLTSPIAAAEPYTGKGLSAFLEASRLTSLANNLVSPILTTETPEVSSAFRRLLEDFESTSKSYTDLLRAAEVSKFDPALFAIPARGYFASADTLVQLDRAFPVERPLQRARESTREEASLRREGKLELLLNKLDSRLCKLWRGAHLAAASDNPDRIRHACVSVRELMTQVMHKLAPTSKVLEWVSVSAQLHNGQPTRQTRLRYICEPVANGALCEYVRVKIDSVVTLADVFQKGTHGIGVEWSALELQLMFNGIEEALCSLIEIAASE